MPYLIQRKSDGSLAQQWQLSEQSLVFGRGPGVDVPIEDSQLSKQHFRIEPKGSGYVIRDLQSTNGTWIDKRPITEHDLAPGDRIVAGDTVFIFDKGLATVIGELAKENKGYKTVLKEISKATAPREKPHSA